MSLERRFVKLAHRHSLWDVWRDFLQLAATSIANAADLRPEIWKRREDEYLKVAAKYAADDIQEFCSIQGDIAMRMESPADVLGQAYMALELSSKWHGQFFTPDSLCEAMAAALIDHDFSVAIEQRGFVTLYEPSIGGGATVIGLYRAMLAAGRNPQTQLHVTGIDIDIKAIHMAYIQLSLLNIPAVLIHGNTLTRQAWDYWYTPAHIFFGWNYRLRQNTEHSTNASPPPQITDTTQLQQAALFDEVAA